MQIFISHISEEKPLALVMKDWLESSFPGQIKVFVSSDPDDIPAGTKWLNKIGDALKDSTLLIILYSPQSTLRPWINFEAGCGWIKDIPIMPICHSGLKVSQIGAPISSFQGLEIEANEFSKRFFEGVATHAGLPNAPRLATEKFMTDVKTAIGGIESPKVMKNTSTEKNTEFSEEQIKIMKRLAMIKESGRNDMGEINFARLLRMKVVILQYHIELLVDEKYIYKMFMVGEPSRYSIAQKGINYLVNNGHYE